MTNEEVVALIKEGHNTFLSMLWEQVEKFAYAEAKAYFFKFQEVCTSAGVALDDLKQESYFAFLKALETYDPDKGYKFITYMGYPLQNAFKELSGIRGKSEPMNSAKSISEPIGEDELTLEDTIEDKQAKAAIDLIVASVYNEQLRSDLEECLNRLPIEQAYVIRQYYYEGKSFKSIAEELAISEKLCRYKQRDGLQKLRRGRNRKLLEQYREDILSGSVNYRGGLSLWKTTGCSCVELSAAKLESVTAKYKKL